jgi:hypothetical protein
LHAVRESVRRMNACGDIRQQPKRTAGTQFLSTRIPFVQHLSIIVVGLHHQQWH